MFHFCDGGIGSGIALSIGGRDFRYAKIALRSSSVIFPISCQGIGGSISREVPMNFPVLSDWINGEVSVRESEDRLRKFPIHISKQLLMRLWRVRRRMKIWSAQACLRLGCVSKAAESCSTPKKLRFSFRLMEKWERYIRRRTKSRN